MRLGRPFVGDDMRLFIAFVIAACWFYSAHAQPRCATHTKLTDYLAKKYKEAQQGFGITNKGKSVLEIYTSERGTWTVLMTNSVGVTCIVAVGHSWEKRNQAPKI